MKNLVLVEPEEEPNVEIIALQTNIENEVSFVYQFNKFFSTNFAKTTNIELEFRNQIFSYSVFQFMSSHSGFNYLLYKNKPNSAVGQVKDLNTISSLDEIFELTPYLISNFFKFNFLIALPKPIKTDFLYQKLILPNPIVSKLTTIDQKIVRSKKNILF